MNPYINLVRVDPNACVILVSLANNKELKLSTEKKLRHILEQTEESRLKYLHKQELIFTYYCVRRHINGCSIPYNFLNLTDLMVQSKLSPMFLNHIIENVWTITSKYAKYYRFANPPVPTISYQGSTEVSIAERIHKVLNSAISNSHTNDNSSNIIKERIQTLEQIIREK